jgi:hypothetical protein
MMKKLLLITSALFVFSFAVRAQTTYTVVTDTLHYYFNKHHFKTGDTLEIFPAYKSAAATVTVITHCGSTFANKDSVMINGLEAFVAKHTKTANKRVPVRLYLCNLDGNGKPVLPALDSVMTDGLSTQSLAVTTTVQTNVGGPLFHGPRIVTGNFGVLFRNISTISGDTLLLVRTGGKTFTSTASWAEKNSDERGFIRYGGQFVSTTNYTTTQGFGVGTAYEFCVAPRVTYSIIAGQIMPPEIPYDTICTFMPLVFKNISSRHYSNRFFNLNEFCRLWNLYAPFVATPRDSLHSWGDSAISWKFEPEEKLGSTDPYNGRAILGFEQGKQLGTNGQPNEITFSTDSVNLDSSCFTSNQFRARLRPMSIYGRGRQLNYDEDFTICTKYCGTSLGIKPENSLSLIKVFPNPSVNGRTVIKGLSGKNQLSVYNSLGQMVYSQTAEQDRVELNLQGFAAGTYLVHINNGSASRVVKIINQD